MTRARAPRRERRTERREGGTNTASGSRDVTRTRGMGRRVYFLPFLPLASWAARASAMAFCARMERRVDKQGRSGTGQRRCVAGRGTRARGSILEHAGVGVRCVGGGCGTARWRAGRSERRDASRGRVAMTGSIVTRTSWRRLAMNLPCADSARAAGGAMAMPPTNPAVETQNMALRAQKPMAVAWTVVERCVELVRLYSHKRGNSRPRVNPGIPGRFLVSAAPTHGPRAPHS